VPGNRRSATLGPPPRYLPFESLTSALVFLRFCEQLNNVVLPGTGCNSGPPQSFYHGQVIEDFLDFRIIERL